MGDFIDKTYLETIIQTRDLSALTNADGSNSTTINDTVLYAAINKAEAMVKGFVQTKYSLPFSTVPELIKSVALDLTVYYLYERKAAINDRLQVMYENTIDTLKQISIGKITIDTEPGENNFQSQDTQNLIYAVKEDVPFPNSKLEGFV